jgi:hypothetical protein
MSTTTTNLGLLKPELNDPADITQLNSNFDKIDETFQTCAKKVNGVASNKYGNVVLSAIDVEAAPYGYGLGDRSDMTALMSMNELNEAVEPGWYRVYFSVFGFSNGILRIDANESIISKTLIGRINGNSVQLIHNSTDGVTGEWEWVNPPFEADEEYRTTERIDNKAVYKKIDSNGNILYRLEDEESWKYEGVKMELLWENASIASGFAAQIIALDLTEFDSVIIETLNEQDGERCIVSSLRVPVGSMAFIIGFNAAYMQRRKAEVYNGGINFGACQTYTTYGKTSSSEAGWLLKVSKIYGVKGVITE